MTTPLTPLVSELAATTRADRLSRELAGVMYLAYTGFACVQELAEGMAGIGTRPSSGSLRRIFTDYLPAHGLAEYKVLPLFHSGLGVCRLTSYGFDLAVEILDAPERILRSEWTALIEGHHGDLQPEHTAMILAFAREARSRGWDATLLPTPAPVYDDETNKYRAYQPDLEITHPTHGSLYVEVQRHSRAKPGKWYRQLVHQGMVAVVTLTPQARRTMLKHIDAQQRQPPLNATDLQTLMRARAATPTNPGRLWYQVNM